MLSSLLFASSAPLSAYFQSSYPFYLSQPSPLVLCTSLYLSPFFLVPSTSTLRCALRKWNVCSAYRYICTGLAIFFLVLLKVFRFKKLIYNSNEANETLVFVWQFSSFLYLISEHARDSHISERWLQNSVCWSHDSFWEYIMTSKIKKMSVHICLGKR